MDAMDQERETRRHAFALRLLLALGARRDDAEDLAQDVMLRFLERGYQDRGLDESREKALLARMTYNAFVDRLRRFARRPTEALVGDPAEAGGRDRRLERAAFVRDLVAAAGLGADAVELLELRFGRDLTLEEIASHRDCHLNTVRNHLREILGRLRALALVESGLVRRAS
ncbi:MAG: sigma-70 family RNA polymerase sigma factor [Planctomycetota bacterium]